MDGYFFNEIKSHPKSGVRGEERLDLSAVRAGRRTPREATALERRNGAAEAHGLAQVVRLDPADREARVEEVAAARGVHHLLDRGDSEGRVCIASRGKVKKLCLEAVFDRKRR